LTLAVSRQGVRWMALRSHGAYMKRWLEQALAGRC